MPRREGEFPQMTRAPKPRESLNNAPPGILQKCQPPTAPWRGLLRAVHLVEKADIIGMSVVIFTYAL